MYNKREEILINMLNESHELIKNMNSNSQNYNNTSTKDNINWMFDIVTNKNSFKINLYKIFYNNLHTRIDDKIHSSNIFKYNIDILMKTYILKYDKLNYFKILSFNNLIFMRNDITKNILRDIKTYDQYLKYIKDNNIFKFNNIDIIKYYLQIAIKFKSYNIINHVLNHLKYENTIKQILEVAIMQDDKYVIHLIYNKNSNIFIKDKGRAIKIIDLIDYSINVYKYDIVEILLSYPYDKKNKINIKKKINKIKSKYIKSNLLHILKHDNIKKN